MDIIKQKIEINNDNDNIEIIENNDNINYHGGGDTIDNLSNINEDVMVDKIEDDMDVIEDKIEDDIDNNYNGGGKKTKTENISENISENSSENISENSSENIIHNINSNDIEYNIDFLIDNDEKLINIEHVKKQVDIYIDNYNSDIMKKYNSIFNKLYQKYSNKNYKIKIVPFNDKTDSNINTKIIVLKNDNKSTLITELIKPYYIFYDNDSNLYKLKTKISNEREELLYKYKILIAQVNLSVEEKHKFEKERDKFIKLLEEYYIYTLYHKKINKILKTNKTNLIVQSSYYLEKDNNISFVLSGETYLIDNTIIENINNYNIDKLTQYNNIILKLSGNTQNNIKNDKQLIEEIKIYLDKKEKIELIKNIETNKITQDNYINYIIHKLPIINS